MTNDDMVAQGRESFERQAWGEAYALLSGADQAAPLGLDDLERLALAAALIGKDADSADAGARAHHESLRLEDPARAARCAFWVGFHHLARGDVAQGLGWLARAARVLEDRQLDCAERGYLLVPLAIRATDEGDYAAACATFTQAGEIAERFGERELATMARYGRGQALVRSGRVADGIALMDEAMVGITSGDVSPTVVGALYCSAIEVWKGIFDLRRAQEWTAALSRWCDSQPDLVPFRGQCLVFRAEIMQLHGAWPDAMEEALRASERLSDTPEHPAAGAAVYQQAELHRLRGDLVSAEEAYRQASQLGRSPHPGLARLRLAQGQVETARVAMRGVMDEKHDRATRATLLSRTSKCSSRRKTCPARGWRPTSCGRWRQSTARRCSMRSAPRRRVRCCSAKAMPVRHSLTCVGRGERGASLKRRMTRHASESWWVSRVARSRTRTVLRWNSMPRAWHSSSSVPPQTSSASTSFPGPRALPRRWVD